MDPLQGNGSQINSELGMGLCWGGGRGGGVQNCLAPPVAVRLLVFTAIMSGKLVLKATTESGGEDWNRTI